MSFDATYGEENGVVGSYQERPENVPTRSTGMAFSRKMWAKDSESKSCTGCTKKFTQFLRRHHCRGCGKVFCDACTRQKELLVKGDKKMKKERVCAQCSTNHAIDREEILFKLLGPDLGGKYFYFFKRTGYGELDSLTELSADELDAVYDSIGVADHHRAIITKKLSDCKLTLLGGSAPMAMGLMGETMGTCDLSRSPEGMRGSLVDVNFGDIGRLMEEDPPTESIGRDSPKLNGREKVDIKHIKKKWQEDIRQMDNERQRRQAQLHVLDASMGAQAQMLSRLKQACADEETKVGRLEALEEEVSLLRSRYKVMENEEMWREEEITTAAADHAREVAERKAHFEGGTHRQDACQLCGKAYKLLFREHHCRTCYRSACEKCTRGRVPDRCCDWCMAMQVLSSTAWGREVQMSRAFRLTQLKELKKASHAITAQEPDLMSRTSLSPTPPLRPRVLSTATIEKSTMQSDSVLDRV